MRLQHIEPCLSLRQFDILSAAGVMAARPVAIDGAIERIGPVAVWRRRIGDQLLVNFSSRKRFAGKNRLAAAQFVRRGPAAFEIVETRREVEATLRCLGVETIDLCQVHWPEPENEIEEGWEALTRLREQGKIRWIGVSNFSVKQMKRVQKIAPITSLQPSYSMLSRKIEAEILPFAQANGIGVIGYSPCSAADRPGPASLGAGGSGSAVCGLGDRAAAE